MKNDPILEALQTPKNPNPSFKPGDSVYRWNSAGDGRVARTEDQTTSLDKVINEKVFGQVLKVLENGNYLVKFDLTPLQSVKEEWEGQHLFQ